MKKIFIIGVFGFFNVLFCDVNKAVNINNFIKELDAISKKNMEIIANNNDTEKSLNETIQDKKNKIRLDKIDIELLDNESNLFKLNNIISKTDSLIDSIKSEIENYSIVYHNSNISIGDVKYCEVNKKEILSNVKMIKKLNNQKGNLVAIKKLLMKAKWTKNLYKNQKFIRLITQLESSNLKMIDDKDINSNFNNKNENILLKEGDLISGIEITNINENNIFLGSI